MILGVEQPGLELNRALELPDSLVRPAELTQHEPEPVVGLCHRRCVTNRRGIAGGGGGHVLEPLSNDPQLVVRFGEGGIASQCCFEWSGARSSSLERRNARPSVRIERADRAGFACRTGS